MIPQFRIRTEYSFRRVYGKLPDVVARLADLGCPGAGIVDLDGSTWGHAKWERECSKKNIEPMFGIESSIVRKITEGDDTAAPRSFALAKDTRALYRLNKLSLAQGGRLTTKQAKDAGVIWFSGELTDVELLRAIGAHVTVDQSSALLRGKALSAALKLNRQPIPISDNYFPSPEDKPLFELIDRARIKTTPQYILPPSELSAIQGPGKNIEKIFKELTGVRLAKAPMIKVAGSLEVEVKKGVKARKLKMTPEYKARLKRELEIIAEKGFESYFLIVADMVRYAKTTMLVGPARGSAAGSLVCWLLGITEIDPLQHGLIFERFIDITRQDLPDIDMDFNDSKRHLVFEYMEEKYGKENVGRIGTVSELRPKSIIGLASKKLAVPYAETEAVKAALFIRSSGDSRANNTLEDTLRETLPGRDLLEKYPTFSKVGALEGHASHTGVHAAGLVVCNDRIEDFCSVTPDGIIQLDKVDAEGMGLLKIDVLGLRTLGLLEDVGRLPNSKFYSLPLDNPEPLKLFNERKYAGLFQWEGQALQTVTNEVTIKRFEDLVHLTALARPGPLGSGAAERFLGCANGDKVEYIHPIMEQFLGETNGLFLYQEQVLNVCREIGLMSWSDVTALRKAMSKSLGQEFFGQYADRFMDGAVKNGVDEQSARKIWDEMCTFGAWGFNKSHAVSYALVSYWTAWCKFYHPLEYAAASLRHAKDDDQSIRILRELKKEGIDYVPFDPNLSEENWVARDGKLIGGFLSIKGVGPSKAEELLAARRGKGFTPKQREFLSKATSVFSDIFPAHTLWADVFRDPVKHGVQEGYSITELADLPHEGYVFLLVLMVEKDDRDENENLRIAKRKGKIIKGDTRFVDMTVTDDSSVRMLLRVGVKKFEKYGPAILNYAVEGETWLLVLGRKVPGYNMVNVESIKCLNDPGLFLRSQNSTKSSEVV